MIQMQKAVECGDTHTHVFSGSYVSAGLMNHSNLPPNRIIHPVKRVTILAKCHTVWEGQQPAATEEGWYPLHDVVGCWQSHTHQAGTAADHYHLGLKGELSELI